MMYIICSLLLCVILILEVESQSLLPQNNCENTSPRETEDSVMSRKLNEALETINKKFQNEISLLKDEIMQMKGKEKLNDVAQKVVNQNKTMREFYVALKNLSDAKASSDTKFETRLIVINQTIKDHEGSISKLTQDLLNLNVSINFFTKSINRSDTKLVRFDTRLKNIEDVTGPMLAAIQREGENDKRMNGTIWSLQNDIRSIQKDILNATGIERKMANLERSMQQSEMRISFVNDELQGLKLRCGFTARLGNNTILGRKETLPFRQTYVNVGNAFNTSDFKFYAPVSGMYYFHLMVCSQRRYRSTANIVKGQKNIGFVYAEDQSNYDCAGNGVMTELASGEAVWASAAHDSNYDPNTFFTGFLATP